MSVEAQREHREQREHRGQEARVAPSRRASHRPVLSLILLSEGNRVDLERALTAVAGRCKNMEAQILVVFPTSTVDFTALESSYPCVTFLDAPEGSSQAAMREIGMARTSGDIVSFRTDSDVGDGVWLDAFRSLVGTVEDDVPLEVEVAIATSVEQSAAPPERLRGRSAVSLAPGANGGPRRRNDYLAAKVGAGDTPARPRSLGAEM